MLQSANVHPSVLWLLLATAKMNLCWSEGMPSSLSSILAVTSSMLSELTLSLNSGGLAGQGLNPRDWFTSRHLQLHPWSYKSQYVWFVHLFM